MADQLPAPFTTTAALAAGLTHRQIYASELTTLTRGVRTVAGSSRITDECRAVAQILPPACVFTGVTALRLLGTEVPWQLEKDDRIHVVAPRRGWRPQRLGVVAHFCAQRSLTTTEVDGVRLTSAAWTWLLLASALDVDVDAMVVLGDSMMRRGSAVETPAELEEAARSTWKMKGIATCREALPLVRPRTDSSMETRLRLLLVHAGLPCPDVNVEVLGSDGAFLALLDLAFARLKLALEYDGDLHRTDQGTWRSDVRRREVLRDQGWEVLVFTADDVLRRPDEVVRRVRRAYDRACRRTGLR
ncbi:hypothetical protein C8046_17025 [Serinibacter arcticus]|uniref:DUF559 domain-containing protein n=1 Tax=Serinibacter arcticus TaxID=1655435 RepID=A0A2U1ZYM7_9MICO|nr:DUF559 domain-containing protein [Serinibacter arcticus]PWD52095.1 hypothetical protein C8046_17025 [Serinibacter arcticus]